MEPTADDLMAIAMRIRTGSIRHDPPEKTWGGMGNGRRCDACRRPIETTDLELEADFDNARTTLRFQQNDYIGWITRAREDATRDKRLNQMLDELVKGGVYMNMAHAPSRKVD